MRIDVLASLGDAPNQHDVERISGLCCKTGTKVYAMRLPADAPSDYVRLIRTDGRELSPDEISYFVEHVISEDLVISIVISVY